MAPTPVKWVPHGHVQEFALDTVHINVMVRRILLIRVLILAAPESKVMQYCSGAGTCDLTGYGCQCFEGYARDFCEVCRHWALPICL